MWRSDVYLASYSRHVLDVWSDHFRHIVCIVRAAFGTHLQYRHRENHPRRALYFHFSIFLLSLVSESERGNLHYDKVAISRDLLAQSDLVTGPCIMYEQPARAKYQPGLGGGGGWFFATTIFVWIKRKLTIVLGFRYKLYISDKMNFGVVDDWVVADLSKGILNIFRNIKFWVFMEILSGSTGFGYKSNGQFSFLLETSNKKRLKIGIYGRNEWHDWVRVVGDNLPLSKTIQASLFVANTPWI